MFVASRLFTPEGPRGLKMAPKLPQSSYVCTCVYAGPPEFMHGGPMLPRDCWRSSKRRGPGGWHS
eukprot:5156965-Pyramimonas_sp.AAC.1